MIGNKLNDVIDVYGKAVFNTTETSDIWFANFKGISIDFKWNVNIIMKPFNENAHLDP